LTSVVIPLNLQNSNLGALSLVFFREKIEVTSSLFPFLIALSNQFVLGIYGVQENQKYIKTAEQLEKLSKFVSPEVFQSILKTKDIGIRVENTLCTILFSDIQGFTSMSERLHPPRIAALLNEYFSLMVEILFRYNGSLDKFIGDAIMAIFGAPLSREDDAERAIYAAIEMQRAIHGMNQKRSEGERFHVRIGINTGYCVAGRIGSYQRMEYTVLGDTVNIASRIESNGKAGHIMIGEATHALIGPQFEVVELNPLKVKNKNNPIRTFDVLYPLP
jgi:adenylate cyclase